MFSARRACALLSLVGALGCRERSPAPGGSAGSSPAPGTSAPAHRPSTEPLSGERVEVPGGSFVAGSSPGEPGREPELEPRRERVELGPYQIDRLPYPNDPRKPALTSVGREQAARLCAERGARLCTELEWERACKGPESEPYSTGAAWDPQCLTAPATCASGFDVLGLGTLREWTASAIIPPKSGPLLPAVRGAPRAAASVDRRCAHRSGLDAETHAEDLGFRCCAGAPNAALVREPREGQTFVRAKISAEQLSALFEKSPQTRAVARDIVFFREPDAANTVVDRGPGDRKGFLFTVAPLRWNPVAGVEFLVVTARSGERTSFVVVFHVLGEGEYLLASSFVMKDEVGPVALAYNGYIRPRLHFSTCWGCPGETGKILYRAPDAAIVLQP